jgi:electron transfer flavoprotein beta subunit
MKTMADKCVNIFPFSDFPDQDERKYGLSGSPTKVIRMFPPEKNDIYEIWTEESSVLTTRLIEKLRQMKYI